ncbi:MAG: hypothetical protein IJV08_06010 [Bacteroidaceae bacterium]|nr:hypothetical protein [Bacteroidaceae bacterium]
MKRIYLTLALLVGVANFQLSSFNFQLCAAFAQDFMFEFADAQGTLIPDGSVVTITKAEVADDGSGDIIMNSGVYAKRVDADDDQLVRIAYEVTQKDNGDLQMCFPVNCIMVTQASGATNPGVLRSSLHSIDTEWFPTAYGNCTVKVRLEAVVKAVGDNYAVIDDGPTVTLRFVYSDGAGVSSSAVSVATPVAYYSLSGQRLPGKPHGLTLVRLSDGRVVKRILK